MYSLHDFMSGISGQPFAMKRTAFTEMVQVLPRFEASGIEAAILSAKSLKYTYSVSDGVAVLPVRGTMRKNAPDWMQAMGWAMSTDAAGQQLRMAVADPGVKSIVLDIDSPGGSVDGSFTLADQVRELSRKKTVIAFVDGLAASAAYLVASAADKIVTNQSGEAGSIGVFATRIDWTEMDAKFGVKVDVVYSGKFKPTYNPDTKLDPEWREEIQRVVNQYHEMFTAKVTENRRGFDAQYADGRVFVGNDALAKGFVDRIGERSDAIALAKSLAIF